MIDPEKKSSIYGDYKATDQKKVDALPDDSKKVVSTITDAAKRNVLLVVSTFPCFMLVCYLILIGYFQTKGWLQAGNFDFGEGRSLVDDGRGGRSRRHVSRETHRSMGGPTFLLFDGRAARVVRETSLYSCPRLPGEVDRGRVQVLADLASPPLILASSSGLPTSTNWVGGPCRRPDWDGRCWGRLAAGLLAYLLLFRVPGDLGPGDGVGR